MVREIANGLLNDKEFCFYLFLLLITFLIYLFYRIYIWIGIKKLFCIMVSILLCVSILFIVRNALKWKYSYAFLNDFYYDEEYYFENYVQGGETLVIKYKYGKLVYISGRGTTNEVSHEVWLNGQERKELKEILKRYQVLSWNKQGKEHLKRNSFYCLSSAPGVQYIGLSKVEMGLRKDFNSSSRFGEKSYFFSSDNLPEHYNEFSTELWKFVLDKTKSAPWEEDLIESSKYYLKRNYPVIATEKHERVNPEQIWYFDFTECYEDGRVIRFNFDSSAEFQEGWYKKENLPDDLLYEVQRGGDVFYMDNYGQINYINLGTDNSLKIDDVKIRKSTEMDKEKLKDLLEKYQVVDWGTKNRSKTETEHMIKKCFIYLYDMQGNKMRLILDNTELPEEYDEFKQELLDFISKT